MDSLDLLGIFKGFVRNYQSLLLKNIGPGERDSQTRETTEEIAYFAHLGEMLGYQSYQEYTPHKRPADLTWWDGDKLILHLERENQRKKSIETIEKLLENGKDNASYCIAILNNIKLGDLQDIKQKAQKLLSRQQVCQEILTVCYFYGPYSYKNIIQEKKDVGKVIAYLIRNGKKDREEKAFFGLTKTGYWYMELESDIKA